MLPPPTHPPAPQLALDSYGYAIGEDELRWWMFSDQTLNALKTFQACNGLPESGVCDEATWRLLMGEEGKTAKPADLEEFGKKLRAEALAQGGEVFEDDLGKEEKDGRVWLVGEQRWEKRVKST